ncbi:hypothetical protein [Trueperella sp. LYQ143]|uniref:hypothetical protein n=1 Tax=Trueperella sp. LYQ143 TaxID=3391059 RepID=UPI003982F593
MTSNAYRARHNDPDTSHKAAARLSDIEREYQRILTAFDTHGDMTDSELEEIAVEEQWPHAGNNYYRRRRSDLKNAGKIFITPYRRENRNGNSEAVWTIAPVDFTDKQPELMLDSRMVIFRFDNNYGWIIEGQNLTPGKTVTVTTRNNSTHKVIVQDIISADNTTMRAYYAWPESIGENETRFTYTPDNRWVVIGPNLAQGQYLNVKTRSGKTRRIKITEVLKTDENTNKTTARFSFVRVNRNTQNRFVKDLDTGKYYVKGRRFAAGDEVSVRKRDKTLVQVRIDSIVEENDGFLIGTFTSLDGEKQELNIGESQDMKSD